SSLVDLLASQTKRRVGLVRHAVVGQGVVQLREEVAGMRGHYQYVIFDVVDQTSLKTIANALHHLPVLGGSSALAEELPVKVRERGIQDQGSLPPSNGMGILCAAGSLMPQTKAQVEYMRQRGASVFELDTLKVLDQGERSLTIQDLCRRMGAALQQGDNVVVHTSNDPEVVAKTKEKGQDQGQSTTEVSRLVSEALAEVVASCVEQLGLNRLMIAGGDTSAAVCSRLGIKGMRVWHEIEPGIPSCVSLGDRPLFLVLKSGSFGSPDFFAKAIAHLKDGGTPGSPTD
ncbi:MAG: four-carbon acid sugar kinase family protein, partial [Firmicutes bacterium]|nr:four-carbon acid sugar kinase family protein [Bacillota bacterium]